MAIRRVVTGTHDGKAVFLSDGPPANLHHFQGWPGHSTSVVWSTPPVPALTFSATDEPQPGMLVTPPPGETRLMVVRLPPDASIADSGFDGPRFAGEAAAHIPGLAECFEPDGSGMHRTDSIDYDVVLDGEIWLELDDGAEVHLKQGDIVVQGGTRHAWRNKSKRTTTMLFVLVGANPSA